MSPDRRRHRGAHPGDATLFAVEELPKLRAAVWEVSWLLGRGYPLLSATAFAGGRHQLRARQREAVLRASCSDASKQRREAARVPAQHLVGQAVYIDALNVLISLEAALSGGLLLACRDGCTRDLSSLHGTYRIVEETEEAIRLVRDYLHGHDVARVVWWMDRPVSNSGRLAGRIRDAAGDLADRWSVLVVEDSDPMLAGASAVVATADSQVLEQSARTVDLVSPIVHASCPEAWWIDLTGSE